jgi:hypothetical protein
LCGDLDPAAIVDVTLHKEIAILRIQALHDFGKIQPRGDGVLYGVRAWKVAIERYVARSPGGSFPSEEPVVP